jgi:hypothetical protein
MVGRDVCPGTADSFIVQQFGDAQGTKHNAPSKHE